jgi:hypothetical protein
MPFKKYHNEPSCLPNRIDAAMSSAQTKTESAFADITSTALSKTIHMDELSWKVKEVDLNFSSSTARSFTISKLVGANIIQNRNNKFWFFLTGYGTRHCTIPSGFYSDSTFPTAIKAALEAAFADSSLTFTVSYVLRKMRIVASTPTAMRFVYEMTGMPHAYSTAAANMGFSANSATGTTVNADLATDIGVRYDIIAETSNTALSYVLNEPIEMDSDSALYAFTGTAAVSVSLRVSYGA